MKSIFSLAVTVILGYMLWSYMGPTIMSLVPDVTTGGSINMRGIAQSLVSGVSNLL